MASLQPDGMINDNGVILTVGMQCGYDRSAIVLPLASDSTLDATAMCHDAVVGFAATQLPLLLACLSSSAFVRFIAGDGMIDGRVPYREDYGPTENPGTRDTVCSPSQVAALLVFYEDPADATGEGRIRVAKNFIPGVPNEDLSQDYISDDLKDKLGLFADPLLNGFSGSGSGTYYRVLAAVAHQTPGTAVKRIITAAPRGYVCTQRRRLIPR